ncbi:MAG TPA: hypothetical protein VK013_06030 [Myxococcaceae bacterium]|nr:hypothetical protein [Myxococcaceae bacterium]
MPVRSLRELLVQERLSRWERRELAAALGQHPWLWPHEPELERRAHALGCARPPSTELGEVLLLTVRAGACPEGGLARLTPLPTRFGAELAFGMRAMGAMQHAFGRVFRDLPQLTRPQALLRRESWVGVLLYGGPTNQTLLDGESFGLPFALSAASLLADRRVPEDLTSTAVLRTDGTLAPVEGLSAKLRVVMGNALGVRRVLVPALQLEEAQEVVDGQLEILGAETLEEAVAKVFPGLGDVLPDTLRDPRKARASARALYRLALRPGRPLLGWTGVARTAEQLEKALGDEAAEHREMAAFARQVAQRHHGAQAPLPWPSDEVLRHTHALVRYTMLAHVLQSITESGEPNLEEVLEKAREQAPPLLHCERGGLRLWGAVGRALARLRRYDEAASLLERVVDAWLDGLLAEESTFALSELLRVQGIRGDERALDALLPRVDEVLTAPFLDLTSRAFVELALARAQLEIGLCNPEPNEAQLRPAIEQLERIGEDRGLAPSHVVASALRLAARGHDALGTVVRARELRERLSGEKVWELLADLDAAWAAGAPLEAPLKALEQGPSPHFLPRRISEEPLEARVRGILREYPY